MKFNTVGVIGIGTIGSGVVADLVLHGISVIAVDLSETALDRARAEILKAVRFAPMFAKGARKLTRDEALALITFTTRLEDVRACEFIVENVFEEWAVKQPLYRQLDEIAPAGVCFGANTSCISITRLGRATRRPDKVVGMHFMNPVHLMPTVEVIRGHHTSAETIANVTQLFAQLKKEAVMVGDLPGFVSNRISHVFMNEAAFVFQDGLATAAQIDAIFRKCFGHKMGPLETADLIGLDTVVRSLDVLYDSFQDPKFRCCPLLRKMVDAGECGIKSGRGFHAYPGASNQPRREPSS
ncbi:MAG: 3-hydroxyacyl-CoA dehydrogenase family protein [Opitutaceae bacterium]|nr:3-hydroxyacyl-CoA dehydrogenase family protein [Opitutaceae bacterium]